MDEQQPPFGITGAYVHAEPPFEILESYGERTVVITRPEDAVQFIVGDEKIGVRWGDGDLQVTAYASDITTASSGASNVARLRFTRHRNGSRVVHDGERTQEDDRLELLQQHALLARKTLYVLVGNGAKQDDPVVIELCEGLGTSYHIVARETEHRRHKVTNEEDTP